MGQRCQVVARQPRLCQPTKSLPLLISPSRLPRAIRIPLPSSRPPRAKRPDASRRYHPRTLAYFARLRYARRGRWFFFPGHSWQPTTRNARHERFVIYGYYMFYKRLQIKIKNGIYKLLL